MFSFKFFILISFFGFLYSVQVTDTQTVGPPITRSLRDVFNLKPYITPRHSFKATPMSEKKTFFPKKNPIPPLERTIQRRDVPFQQPFLGVPVQIEKVHETPYQTSLGGILPNVPKVPPPAKPLVKNETEAERAERIHKSFDRLLTFVEIVGQVDNYVSSKWKNLVKTVSNFYENEEEPFRVGARRFYGSCPHAH